MSTSDFLLLWFVCSLGGICLTLLPHLVASIVSVMVAAIFIYVFGPILWEMFRW